MHIPEVSLGYQFVSHCLDSPPAMEHEGTACFQMRYLPGGGSDDIFQILCTKHILYWKI